MKRHLRAWARRLKTEALTLWFARHPGTPWAARAGLLAYRWLSQ